MKQAIVFGATGYVGSTVVKKLLDQNISVLAIGRKNYLQATQVLPLEQNHLSYEQLEAINIDQLVKSKKWEKWASEKDTVFYNFAWSGVNRLTDGNITDQFKNISFTSKAIEVSKQLGCIKYINVGSQEEVLLESYLKNHWKTQAYSLNSINYGSAKLINRDMSTLTAYLQKIDYINTRFSVVIDTDLSNNNYVSSCFQKMKDGVEIEPVQNNQLFDIVDLDELAEAYVLIGHFGKNKSDYYIGSGYPMTLQQYFTLFLDYKSGKITNTEKCFQNKTKFDSLFNPNFILEDTGFKIKKEFIDISRDILNK